MDSNLSVFFLLQIFLVIIQNLIFLQAGLLANKALYEELFQFCILTQETLEEGLDYLKKALEIERCVQPLKQNSWIESHLVKFGFYIKLFYV
jgi:hypothetical protein